MSELQDLSSLRLALYVSGSVAAYRAGDVITQLRRRGAEIRVAATVSARHFVSPVVLQALSGHPVISEISDSTDDGHGMGHLLLSSWATLQLAIAASANLIARLAHGFADDAVTASVLASRTPLLVAPAMESAMWENPATQANVDLLRGRGIVFLGPGSGRLASGENGIGHLEAVSSIVEAVARVHRSQSGS